MKKNKIAITTGDPKGIGEELVIKALNILKPDREQILIVGKELNLGYETHTINFENTGKYCYEMLEYAVNEAKKGNVQGILTAPVSKEELNKAGYNFSGQTEILEKLLSNSPEKKAEMLFIAGDFRVMLLTRHIPLLKIKLTEDMIISKTKRLYNFLSDKEKINNPKIAFCALNPHAGENGLLGSEENEIIIPATKKLNEMGINVHGPFSADGLFGKAGKKYLQGEKQEYDAIIAIYHDQALCPVKALCAGKAVNTTIGLDIIRTSPSSGTAYDIAGKNIANPESMVEAMKLLLKII